MGNNNQHQRKNHQTMKKTQKDVVMIAAGTSDCMKPFRVEHRNTTTVKHIRWAIFVTKHKQMTSSQPIRDANNWEIIGAESILVNRDFVSVEEPFCIWCTSIGRERCRKRMPCYRCSMMSGRVQSVNNNNILIIFVVAIYNLANERRFARMKPKESNNNSYTCQTDEIRFVLSGIFFFFAFPFFSRCLLRYICRLVGWLAQTKRFRCASSKTRRSPMWRSSKPSNSWCPPIHCIGRPHMLNVTCGSQGMTSSLISKRRPANETRTKITSQTMLKHCAFQLFFANSTQKRSKTKWIGMPCGRVADIINWLISGAIECGNYY